MGLPWLDIARGRITLFQPDPPHPIGRPGWPEGGCRAQDYVVEVFGTTRPPKTRGSDPTRLGSRINSQAVSSEPGRNRTVRLDLARFSGPFTITESGSGSESDVPFPTRFGTYSFHKKQVRSWVGNVRISPGTHSVPIISERTRRLAVTAVNHPSPPIPPFRPMRGRELPT